MEKKEEQGRISLMNNPLYKDHYGKLTLAAVEYYVNNVSRKVVLFKCPCCEDWSAYLEDMQEFALPISVTEKEKAVTWVKDQGFILVGERFEDKVIYYN